MAWVGLLRSASLCYIFLRFKLLSNAWLSLSVVDDLWLISGALHHQTTSVLLLKLYESKKILWLCLETCLLFLPGLQTSWQLTARILTRVVYVQPLKAASDLAFFGKLPITLLGWHWSSSTSTGNSKVDQPLVLLSKCCLNLVRTDLAGKIRR